MSSRTVELDDRLYAYFRDISVRESDVQRRLRLETSQLEMANMQIAPEQGQFMALLVRLLGARRVLEVGTFTGYSALCMASALPADGSVIACDVSEEWTAIARRYWQEAGVAERIDLRLAPAVDTLEGLIAAGEAGCFDFAFIDADKESYVTYYELALTLLRHGGLMAVDNVLWNGKVADPRVDDADTQAIRAFNLELREDERVAISLVPIGDGLTLALKK